MTEPRSLSDKIIELLEEHHLLSAPQMLELLAAQGEAYNKTSVYRALERLQSAEKICKHAFDQEACYELREHHHAHLVCTNCGKIATAPCTVPEVSPEGFTADHHHLTIFGKCAHCTRS